MLVFLFAAPISLVIAALYWHSYNLEQRALVQKSVAQARSIAQLVDARFGAVEAVLQSLAALPSLRTRRMDLFQLESSYATPPEWLSGLIVTDLEGVVLYDSSQRSDMGQPAVPPRLSTPSNAKAISEPFWGGFFEEPAVSMTVPVEVKGKHVLNLTGVVRLQEFTKLHLAAQAPSSWLFTILDEHAHIVSRSRDLPRFFGKPPGESLLNALSGGDEGWFEGKAADDRAVLGVFSRAPKSGWIAAIGIPAEELAAQLMLRLVLSGAALLVAGGVAFVAVWVVAGNIAASVRALREPALALSRGETPQLSRFYFREAEEVANELLKASDLLHSAQHRSNHDALTGLPNRVLLGHLMDKQIAVARRSGVAFSVLFVDLDGFKHVNDTLGHQAGDDLLIQVAKRMQTHTRAADTVSRYAGDEFAVLLFGADAGDASRVAESLLEAISFPYRVADRSCTVSASIGVATFPIDGTTTAELLNSADTAMYAAKAKGKNRVVAAAAVSSDSPRDMAPA